MGGSKSKSTIEALSQQISNIAESTVQNCVVNTSQDQLINVANTGWKWSSTIDVSQQTEVTSQCFSDVNKQIQLQNDIMNAIAQSSSADGVALLSAFGASDAEANANLRSIIQTNVTMSNIQSNYNNIRQSQRVNYSNSGIVVFDTVNVTQGAKVFAAATLQQVDTAGIFNKISSLIDQSSTATTSNPLDFIAKAIGAIGNVLMTPIMLFVIFIIFIIVMGVGIFMYAGSGSSKKPTQTGAAD